MPDVRIPIDDLQLLLERILVAEGFHAGDARACALLFAETTCDGVYTHGVARFPRFLETLHNGCVLPQAKPVLVAAAGALERWDGQRGPGNLNAQGMMDRAIALASTHGIGCVALANTNHWMRGGSYGWQAAEAGMVGICWTNTLPNLPAWGGSKPALGNNPLVIAVPRMSGHVVLDMAMSQFSFGQLESHRRQGKPLPVDGGFDTDGNLTRDAAAIERSMRPLPIGYWKGSGLSLALDMVASLLSGGQSVSQISANPTEESGLSQIFIAIHLAEVSSIEESSAAADAILQFFSAGAAEGAHIRYPGERVLAARADNLAHGVPVDEALWQHLQAILKP